jgi:hypothetical protein
MAISEQLRQEYASHGDQLELYSERPVTAYLYQHYDNLFGRKSMRSITFRCQKDEDDSDESNVTATFQLCVDPGARRDTTTPPAILGLTRIVESPLAPSIPGRLVGANPTCPATVNVMQGWLEDCRSNHHCSHRSNGPLPLPTRVLDVSSSTPGVVKLVEVRDRPEISDYYVALSHCWGLNQSFKTTNRSLRHHKAGIDVRLLPKTFRDAIDITRLLKIRYLWIDSLCIIQDDGSDWGRESLVMGTYYLRAHLVISASRASSDDEGFLSEREPSHAISIGISMAPGIAGSVYLTMNNEGLSGRLPIMKEPLQGRAWVLQERHLARRNLFFGRRQLYWTCGEVTASELGEWLPGSATTFTSITDHSSEDVREDGNLDHRGEDDHFRKHFQWCRILQEYTGLDLTKDMDRLPALSGIASLISQRTNMAYCAGIWLDGLIPGLLWSRKGFETLRKPSSYRAPSWSWASLDGPREFVLSEFRNAALWATYDVLTKYHSHTVMADKENPFGLVANKGNLMVEGPLLLVKRFLGRYGEVDFDTPRYNAQVIGAKWASSFDTFAVLEADLSDEPGSPSGGSLVLPLGIPCTLDSSESLDAAHVLFLTQRHSKDFGDLVKSRCYFGLLLQPTEIEGVYRRVGVVEGVLFHTTLALDSKSLKETYEAGVDLLERTDLDISIPAIWMEFQFPEPLLERYPKSRVTLE